MIDRENIVRRNNLVKPKSAETAPSTATAATSPMEDRIGINISACKWTSRMTNNPSDDAVPPRPSAIIGQRDRNLLTLSRPRAFAASQRQAPELSLAAASASCPILVRSNGHQRDLERGNSALRPIPAP